MRLLAGWLAGWPTSERTSATRLADRQRRPGEALRPGLDVVEGRMVLSDLAPSSALLAVGVPVNLTVTSVCPPRVYLISSHRLPATRSCHPIHSPVNPPNQLRPESLRLQRRRDVARSHRVDDSSGRGMAAVRCIHWKQIQDFRMRLELRKSDDAFSEGCEFTSQSAIS